MPGKKSEIEEDSDKLRIFIDQLHAICI